MQKTATKVFVQKHTHFGISCFVKAIFQHDEVRQKKTRWKASFQAKISQPQKHDIHEKNISRVVAKISHQDHHHRRNYFCFEELLYFHGVLLASC